jgi:hypothetical protein
MKEPSAFAIAKWEGAVSQEGLAAALGNTPSGFEVTISFLQPLGCKD